METGQCGQAGRQARQWLADDSAEFQQISSESLPTTWSGPVTAFRPCRNWLPKLPGPNLSLTPQETGKGKSSLPPTARAGRERQASSTAEWSPCLRAMRKGQ